MVKYLWDTYAIILLIQGNDMVEKYLDSEGITTTLNISELCAYLLREEMNCEIVSTVAEAFTVIEKIPVDIAINAAKLRHKKRQDGKKWSYVDSIGYILARRIGARFLTGDKEFEGERNVEFIELQ